MKKVLFILLCLVILAGCASKTKQLGSGTVTEQQGLLNVRYVYQDENSQGEIIVNKISKQASVGSSVFLEDAAENQFIINMFCGILGMAFQNETNVKQMQEAGKFRREDGTLAEADFLEDVTIVSVSVFFIDKEDGSRIADCIVPVGQPMQYQWYGTTTEEEKQKQGAGAFFEQMAQNS